MEVQLKKWGNGQGIRFPKEFLRQANISLNETLQAEIQDQKIVISKGFRHRSLEERAAVFGGRLNLSPEVEWPERAGDEVW